MSKDVLGLRAIQNYAEALGPYDALVLSRTLCITDPLGLFEALEPPKLFDGIRVIEIFGVIVYAIAVTLLIHTHA